MHAFFQPCTLFVFIDWSFIKLRQRRQKNDAFNVVETVDPFPTLGFLTAHVDNPQLNALLSVGNFEDVFNDSAGGYSKM
jgi:hypothetical protein